MSGLIEGGEIIALTKRQLSEATCRKWDYRVANYNGQTVQVANYKNPHGELVAQKVRFPNKDFVFLGDAKHAGLYGQHLWPNGGKMVVITEGEIDAMSACQVEDNKWPVVSVPTGAKGAKKALLKEVEWLEKFDSVILMFDNDKEGIAASKECIDVLSPGKIKVASLPLKDANEMLVAGRGAEIIRAKWDARVVRPDGIVSDEDVWERLIAPINVNARPYPWTKLNELTGGARPNELTMWTAGTGVGKSEVVGAIAAFEAQNGGIVGYCALEEPVRKTARRIMSSYIGRRLISGQADLPQDELRKVFDAAVKGKFHFFEHFGSTDISNLVSKIRYMVKALGVTTIILDHISIVVSGVEEGDERRLIDNAMTKLASLVQELPNVHFHVICHLNRPDGKPFEEGGKISLVHLRGSGALAQLSWDVIALERNQQSATKKNLTRLRVLKCRETGNTGEAGVIKYDPETGRFSETDETIEEEVQFPDEPSNDF